MNLTHDEFLTALNWRYATKAFDPSKKISENDWHVLSESLRLSPSSYGLQPWKFIVVQDHKLREKLREVSWNQSQVTDCSHYVVFTTLKSVTEQYVDFFISDIAKTRGVEASTLEGYRNMMISDIVKGPRSAHAQAWAQRQSYIAMGNLMNAAALFKIDACPIEGLDPAAYDKLLGLENSEYATVATVALGYRLPTDKYAEAKKVRFDSAHVIEYIN